MTATTRSWPAATATSIDGGDGIDTLSYAHRTSAVTITLGGAGADTVTDVEILAGSNFGDTLTGDAEDNNIDGGDGNDTIVGGGGSDTLSGGAGTGDTIDYSEVTVGGVEVDLTNASNHTNNQSDTLSGFENVIGSGNADTLTGSAAANVLTGGGATIRCAAMAVRTRWKAVTATTRSSAAAMATRSTAATAAIRLATAHLGAGVSVILWRQRRRCDCLVWKT